MPREWRRDKGADDGIDWDSIIFSAARAGLKPREIDDISLLEVMIYIRAQAAREESEWERAAFIASISANVHLPRQNRLTVDKLLGRKPKNVVNISGMNFGPKTDLRAKAIDAQKTVNANLIWGSPEGHAMYDDPDQDQ